VEDLDSCSTEALMVAYVDGVEQAFAKLYAALSPRVFSYLLRLTRHRERAEDLLKITFGKVHRARASYLRGAPVVPWVFAIARRSFLDERRAAKHRTEDLSMDGRLPEPTAEPRGVSEDVSDRLEQALRRLPDSYREAIVLTKVTGLSIAEAASVLGATPTAVKLRVHRGYTQLREELKEFNRQP
jgi:RNA polymerase sigma-70 factor (ECF subfamily)